MGRKTHDFMVRAGQPAFPGLVTCVLTRNTAPPEYKGVHWVTSDTIAFVNELREQPGKDIWLMGGSDLACTFFQQRMVTVLRLGIVPVLLGKGVPLFATFEQEITLKLTGQQDYSNGVVGLEYDCL